MAVVPRIAPVLLIMMCAVWMGIPLVAAQDLLPSVDPQATNGSVGPGQNGCVTTAVGNGSEGVGKDLYLGSDAIGFEVTAGGETVGLVVAPPNCSVATPQTPTGQTSQMDLGQLFQVLP